MQRTHDNQRPIALRHSANACARPEITGKTPNAMINDALEEYLSRINSDARSREIVRQCRRANRADTGDDWEAFADLGLKSGG